MKKIVSVIGARPQFIKHAPIDLHFKGRCRLVSVHTGQHFDQNMSQVFFDELGISPPDYMLSTGGLSHGKQTGMMLADIEDILLKENPHLMLVYGDTNSTIAGALAAAKLHIPVAHIEAGLRSYNREMPEEINRVLTDHVSDILFCPTITAIDNLKREGIYNNVHKTGDVMADMLKIAVDKGLLGAKEKGDYIYATIHRPYNTDEPQRLRKVLDALNRLQHKVIMARHPRTKNIMLQNAFSDSDFYNIQFIEPVSYFENLRYLFHSKLLITDSGGMQKEAYMLKKRCITVRKETEWIETLHDNWNTLVFDNLETMQEVSLLSAQNHQPNLYGNGHAAEEIYDILNKFLS